MEPGKVPETEADAEDYSEESGQDPVSSRGHVLIAASAAALAAR